MDIKSLKADIIAAIDIQKFYESWLRGEHIKLERGGWSNRVRCPFHEDNSTPNFFVSLESGSYKCHACSAGGSIFDFWLFMNGKEKTEFMDAVAALASVAGISVKEWSDGKDYSDIISCERRRLAEKSMPEVHKESTEDEFDTGKPPISRDLVNNLHSKLTAEVVSYLSKQRGLTRKTIDRCLIGWDADWPRRDRDGNRANGRITIPVLAVNGSIRNIRGHSSQCGPAFKMVNYIENRGFTNELGRGKPPRLYNIDKMVNEKWNHVVICEGEFDAILLTQELHDAGFKDWGGITPTHGVGNFQPWWVELLSGKYVYFCFDADSAGKIGAVKAATEHFLSGIKIGKFNVVKIIELPGLTGTKEDNDITDFFVKHEFTVNDFIKAVGDTPPLISGGADNDDAVVEPVYVENFTELLQRREYIDVRVMTPIAIVGQTSKRYHAIRQCEVEYCPGMESGSCCTNTAQVHTIPYGHKSFISACMNTERATEKEIGQIICKKGNASKLKIRTVQKVVVELHFAHHVTDRVRAIERDGRMVNEQEFTPSPVYIMQPPGARSVRPTNYMATGWVRTHPRNGLACFFVESMELIEDDWSKFDSSALESISHLKLLESIGRDGIVESIVDNVTRIYESDEILYAILLTYLSPLRFNFNGEEQRGWINTAIVGDTGTGKSATFGKFSDWIGIGSSFSALSGSRTGLLYAIKQGVGGDWQLSVGRYVTCDGQILAIDEVQEMDPVEIKKMAIAMDTGRLSVERVVTGGFQTRTRAVFILNPKDAKGKAATVGDFQHGCESICNCFDYMFIRRIDLSVFVTGNKDPAFYNRRVDVDIKEEINKMAITPEALRSLVFWAWTRKPHHVIFTDEAIDECLNVSTKLAIKYGHAEHVPLANPQDLRLKIARISAAFATLSCSFGDNYQKLIIKTEHVGFSARFLDVIYSSSACELNEASERKKKLTVLDDYDVASEAIDEAIKTDAASSSIPGASKSNFLHLMLIINTEDSTKRLNLQHKLGVRNTWLRAKLSMLLGFNMIDDTKYGVKKTRKWLLFMKKWRMDEPGKYKLMCDLHTESAMSAARVPDTSGMHDERDDVYCNGDSTHQSTHDSFNSGGPDVRSILADEPSWVGASNED